jgi:hypothetical protein
MTGSVQNATAAAGGEAIGADSSEMNAFQPARRGDVLATKLRQALRFVLEERCMYSIYHCSYIVGSNKGKNTCRKRLRLITDLSTDRSDILSPDLSGRPEG